MVKISHISAAGCGHPVALTALCHPFSHRVAKLFALRSVAARELGEPDWGSSAPPRVCTRFHEGSSSRSPNCAKAVSKGVATANSAPVVLPCRWRPIGTPEFFSTQIAPESPRSLSS